MTLCVLVYGLASAVHAGERPTPRERRDRVYARGNLWRAQQTIRWHVEGLPPDVVVPVWKQAGRHGTVEMRVDRVGDSWRVSTWGLRDDTPKSGFILGTARWGHALERAIRDAHDRRMFPDRDERTTSETFPATGSGRRR